MNKYIRKQRIGKSDTNKLYLVKDVNTDTDYLMKSIDISETEFNTKTSLFKKLLNLSHPNLVKYKDCFINESMNELIIVMEYFESMRINYYRKNIERYY